MKKQDRGGVPALIPFLVLVSVIFIGILIFAYLETKNLNPQMIDQERVRTGENACATKSA